MAQVVTPLSKEVPAVRRSVRALLLGDRIDTSGLDQTDVISTAPMTFRAGHSGLVAVFRFGVVVLFDLSVLEADEVLRRLGPRVIRPVTVREDETAVIEAALDRDEQILPGGQILLKLVTPEHVMVVADALAKSVILLATSVRSPPSSSASSHWRANWPSRAARRASARRSSSTSAMRSWCSIGCRAVSRLPTSRMRCGTGRTSSGSMRACRRSTSSANALMR